MNLDNRIDLNHKNALILNNTSYEQEFLSLSESSPLQWTIQYIHEGLAASLSSRTGAGAEDGRLSKQYEQNPRRNIQPSGIE